ncbi:CDP-diglyceride synthetase [Aliidiomarina iranensis]|uniref:Phosphatidate cytidylyltransferase n=1 Tax=Aliidiomarina iranensis TaxID=1434071 RepID=A0A432W0J0_9GAMM|nr:phosphatidate cytidylyltransferase [Aliidiomarina iranensis]RUO22539.1 CDP-diglyceride synthetase [Aliidiomarina iranensis]
MLKQRILTAAVLIPLALGIIFLLPLPYFGLAITVVLAIAAWEWSPLMGVRKTSGRLAYTILNTIILVAVYWLTPIGGIWSSAGMVDWLYYIVLIGGIWWLLAIALVFNFPRSKALWQRSRIFVGAFGILILVPAWVALMSLRSLNYDENPMFGGWAVLFVFVLVWAADVGAYFAGKRFGRRKLMPHVSPGKTMEGFIGGLCLATLAMYLVSLILDIPSELLLGYYIVGIATVLVSVFGDLNESMFKRCAGVKDSGSILPGHGGILDRIDSLTSALPIFLLGYLWLIH